MPRKLRSLPPETQPLTEDLAPGDVPASLGEGSKDSPTLEGILDRPKKRLKSDQFFDVTREYQRQNRAGIYYIYRLWPVIDRLLVDTKAKKYIDKLAGPLTENAILRGWGSGDYGVHFCDDESRPRGKTEIAQTVVSVRSDEMPPILDLRELVVGDPKNKSYIEGLRARGVRLPSEEGDVNQSEKDELRTIAAEVLREKVRGDKKPDLSEGVQERVLDMMQDASKQAIQLAVSSASNPLGNVKELLQLFQTLRGEGGNGGGGQLELLKFMFDLQQKNTAMMLELMKAQQQRPAATSSLQDALTIFKTVNGFVRASGEASGTGFPWADVIGHVARVLPSLVASAQARAPQQVLPPGVPAPAAPVVLPPGPAGSAQIPEAAPAGQFVAPLLDDATLLELGSHVVSALSRRVGGDAFAESISTMFGDDAYDVIALAGHNGIRSELLRLPQLAAQLQPFGAAALDAFIREFLAYGSTASEEGEPAAAPEELKPAA